MQQTDLYGGGYVR